MSHVHCPACRFAFNLATSPACPRCAPAVAVARAPVDAIAEVDAALDRLASALGRLADDERDAVAVRLASTEHPDTWAGVIAGAIAAAAIARRQHEAAVAGPAAVPVIRLELEPPIAAAVAADGEPLTPRERVLATLVLALFSRLATVTREAATRFRRW